MSIFSERLRHLRKINGDKPQKTVAFDLGISRGMLSNYELGTREPDYNMLCRLAEYYCVTTDYLLGRTDCAKIQGNNYPDEMEKIWDNCLMLSDRSRSELMSYIELLYIRDKYNENKES